jgi:hypothetical protein
VHKLYCGARQQLVSPYVAAKLAALGQAPLPQLVREGAEQLLRVGQLEAQLMEQFFGGGLPGGGRHACAGGLCSNHPAVAASGPPPLHATYMAGHPF